MITIEIVMNSTIAVHRTLICITSCLCCIAFNATQAVSCLFVCCLAIYLYIHSSIYLGLYYGSTSSENKNTLGTLNRIGSYNCPAPNFYLDIKHQ